VGRFEWNASVLSAPTMTCQGADASLIAPLGVSRGRFVLGDTLNAATLTVAIPRIVADSTGNGVTFRSAPVTSSSTLRISSDIVIEPGALLNFN
jgi:hypothetical protein